jgi:hypothetical protein
MATASHREADDVLVVDAAAPSSDVVESAPAGEWTDQPSAPEDVYLTVWRTQPDDAEADGDPGAEYATAPGVPGRGVIVLSLTAVALCAALDCALSGTLTMFFDLCFVTVCLVGAMAVRREDLFTAGVLAPLVFAAAVFLVSVAVQDAFVVGGSMSGVFLTGLAMHAGGLVSGYAVALTTVAGRVAAARG